MVISNPIEEREILVTLTTDDITKIARLARIGLSQDDKERMVSELSNIMGWIEQLKQVSTDQVDSWSWDISLQKRPDEVIEGGQASKILQNAPLQLQGYFSVPKVVE